MTTKLSAIHHSVCAQKRIQDFLFNFLCFIVPIAILFSGPPKYEARFVAVRFMRAAYSGSPAWPKLKPRI